MKKLVVLVLSVLILAFGSVSASAYDSPILHDTDTENVSSSNSSSNNSSSATATSPKTGASGMYAVLMAAAAFAFGGVAFSAKKKLEK